MNSLLVKLANHYTRRGTPEFVFVNPNYTAFIY